MSERIAKIVGLYTAPRARTPMQCTRVVMAVAGKGLHGDRYAEEMGTCKPPGQVTFITEAGITAC